MLDGRNGSRLVRRVEDGYTSSVDNGTKIGGSAREACDGLFSEESTPGERHLHDLFLGQRITPAIGHTLR